MAFDKFDYLNYLQQNQLKVSQRFHPLFEAVENAFNAIEERMREGDLSEKGLVEITIHRESKQPTLNMKKESIPPSEMSGFSIRDNGVGFRSQNWAAFEEVYTSYKRSFGGKGVGRLSYLLAFARANVTSCYLENDERFERVFTIERSKDGTTDGRPKKKNADRRFTHIDLLEFESRLRKGGSKTLSAFAKQLVIHFFKRFSAPTRIECVVIDEWDSSTLELGQFCRSEFLLASSKKSIKVGTNNLSVTHTKCRSRAVDKHQIMLCADGRVVSVHDVPMSFIPNPSLLPEVLAISKPSIEAIVAAVGKSLKKYLKADIAPIEAEHRKRIEEFCHKNVVLGGIPRKVSRRIARVEPAFAT